MVDTATPVAPVTTSPRRLPSEAYHYELNLSDYWRIIVKRRLIVFVSFLGVLVSAIFYTNLQTPMYQSSASIRIRQNLSPFQMDQGIGSFGTDSLEAYANAITSQEVMERVVVRLGLLPPDARASDLVDKAEEIRGSISASPEGGTEVISITVTYPNPELAASIANQTAQSFSEVDLLQKSKRARNIRQFIEKQLTILTEKLKTTEEKIRAFRQSGKTFGLVAGIEQQLAGFDKERNLLLKQYTEKHPDVIKVDTQIQSLRNQIKKMPAEELEMARLQRELEMNDRGYRMMKEKFDSARIAEVEEIGNIIVTETAVAPTTPISPKKNLNKMIGALLGVLLGLMFAFVVESLDTSIGTIEDVERAIQLPVIGVIPYFNPKQEDVPWWRFDKSVMDFFNRRGDLPPEPGCLIMNQNSFSTLSEAYRILRTFVEFLMEKKEGVGTVIMITSTGPQEGKSLTASNLAITLAQSGKRTLLIDTDLRRPVVHRLFGLKREPGLSEVLLGTVRLSEAVKNMGDVLVGETSQWDHLLTSKMLDRLEIMTTGARTHTPAELLGSAQLKALLGQLRLQYDYVILDTPPVLPVTDARTLGKFADASFFVYRAGKTARRALMRAKGELDLAGVNVKGIILNHATPEVTLTDKYYYQYYDEEGRTGDSRGHRGKIPAKKNATSSPNLDSKP